MGIVIAGIGVPGSGKTTLLEGFAQERGYVYISPDRIREEISGDARIQSDMYVVWGTAYHRMREALKADRSVAFDATQYKPKGRREFIEEARAMGAEKVIGVYFDVSLPVALERNRARDRNVPEHVIERMHRMLGETPPRLEEGFDMLIRPDELAALDL